MSFTDEFGYEDDQPTPDELDAWEEAERRDALHEAGLDDEIAAENRAACWPAAAIATPPEFPFKLDRHIYGDRGPLMDERLGR